MQPKFQNDHWHSRGYLPHYDAKGKYQSITYRLGDSLPFELLLKKLGAPHSNADLHSQNIRKRKISEDIMDLSLGACTLRKRSVAEKKIESWQYFDGKRYDLIVYVVMPNHCHVLIKTYDNWPISKLVASWKKHVTYFVQKDEVLWQKYSDSYYSYKASYLKNKSALECGAFQEKKKNPHGMRGSQVYFWQREYWDRFIRDEKHFNKVIAYIHENPVKAGLVKKPSDYYFSSIYNGVNYEFRKIQS